MDIASKQNQDADIATKLQDLSSDWVKRGNVNYRMYKMCDLQWETFIIGSDKYNADFEIGGSLVACSRNGGPVSVMNKKGNFVSGGTHLLKEHIGIFNACGKLITKSAVCVIAKFWRSGRKRATSCGLSTRPTRFWWSSPQRAASSCSSLRKTSPSART